MLHHVNQLVANFEFWLLEWRDIVVWCSMKSYLHTNEDNQAVALSNKHILHLCCNHTQVLGWNLQEAAPTDAGTCAGGAREVIRGVGEVSGGTAG